MLGVTFVPISFSARLSLMLNVHGWHPLHLRSLLHLCPLRQPHKLLRHEHLSRRLTLHSGDLHVRVRLVINYYHTRLMLRMETWLRLVMCVLLTRLRRLCRGNSDLMMNRLHKTLLPSLYHPSLALRWRLGMS